MKWIVRAAVVLIALCIGVAAIAYSTALRSSRPVGFQVVQVPNPGHDPVTATIWYPTTAQTWPTTLLGFVVMDVAADGPVAGNALPLVIISHGNGGGPGSHPDTAMALAAAGFVVIAPMHTGDNFQDQSAVGTAHWLTDRARHVRAALDFMQTRWAGRGQLAPRRTGVFGFSAGGFTALTSIGATPDLRLIAPHCARTPEFACTILKSVNSELLGPGDLPPANGFAPDERISAAVVAAPGFGFTLSKESLAGVTAPVQLWSGELDTNVPYETNTKIVREGLGALAEFHSVPGAAHFSFLVPCGVIGPPMLCHDANGFDRAAFHRDFNAQVVAFFRAKLGTN